MAANMATSCCTSSSCSSMPGQATALKLPASSNDSLQKSLDIHCSAETPEHESTVGSTTNSNKVAQQADKAELAEVHDVLAPRTPPLSPKLPAAAAAAAAAAQGVTAASASASAADLQGCRQVFQGKRVLIIVSGGQLSTSCSAQAADGPAVWFSLHTLVCSCALVRMQCHQPDVACKVTIQFAATLVSAGSWPPASCFTPSIARAMQYTRCDCFWSPASVQCSSMPALCCE